MRRVPIKPNRKEGLKTRRGLSPMGYYRLEPRASSLCTECSIVASRMYRVDGMYSMVYPGV